MLVCISFLGAFTKLRKATVSFLMSGRPSVRMEQRRVHWRDFHEIWCLNIFRKFVEKRDVSLKSDKINGYFTRRPMYIYHNILLYSS
jgi:hypothetical protein